MEKLVIYLGASQDHFGAYAEHVEGIYGAGATPSEALKNINEAIVLLKETRPPEEIPPILLGEYELEVHYDVVSLLRYYGRIITMPALSSLTGINDKQLHRYMSGATKPRAEQLNKIETALNGLGRELSNIRLV